MSGLDHFHRARCSWGGGRNSASLTPPRCSPSAAVEKFDWPATIYLFQNPQIHAYVTWPTFVLHFLRKEVYYDPWKGERKLWTHSKITDSRPSYMNFQKATQMLNMLRLVSFPGGQPPVGFVHDYHPHTAEKAFLCLWFMPSDRPSIFKPHPTIPCTAAFFCLQGPKRS